MSCCVGPFRTAWLDRLLYVGEIGAGAARAVGERGFVCGRNQSSQGRHSDLDRSWILYWRSGERLVPDIWNFLRQQARWAVCALAPGGALHFSLVHSENHPTA